MDVNGISEILLYLRLVLYPILALTFLMWAFTGEKPGRLRNANYPVFLVTSLLFVALWGSSIVLYTTRDNTAVLKYNSFALLPILGVILVVMLFQLVRNCKN